MRQYVERHGFVQITREKREDVYKNELPILNIGNPNQSTSVQARSCAVCKSATCEQGCPKGNSIPEANTSISKAGNVLNDAFNALKNHSEEEAEDFLQTHSDLIVDNIAFEEDLLLRLAVFNEAEAEKYGQRYQHFMIKAFNNFGGNKGRSWVYGMACPSESMLCGSTCQLTYAMGRGITISMNEAAVANYMMRKGLIKPISVTKESGKSIAVIGSGAVSFHLAMESRDLDHAVTIFEKNSAPGELGDGKILDYKLPLETWLFDLDLQKESGIEFWCDTAIGTVKPFHELAKEFNAVVIALGLPVPNNPNLQGDAAHEVVSSSACLQSKQKRDYDRKFFKKDTPLPAEHDAKDKHVVILGTGDSAVDGAFAATELRQGALSVTLVSRHDGVNAQTKGDFKAYERLLDECGDNLKIEYGMQADTVSKEGGRYVVEGSGKKLEADMVVSAIGNNPGNLPALFELPNLPVTQGGTIEIQLPVVSSKSASNGLLGGFVGVFNNVAVFAGGEVVSGPSLLVKAGKAGIDLAPMIDEYLQNPQAFYEKVERETGRPIIQLG